VLDCEVLRVRVKVKEAVEDENCVVGNMDRLKDTLLVRVMERVRQEEAVREVVPHADLVLEGVLDELGLETPVGLRELLGEPEGLGAMAVFVLVTVPSGLVKDTHMVYVLVSVDTGAVPLLESEGDGVGDLLLVPLELVLALRLEEEDVLGEGEEDRDRVEHAEAEEDKVAERLREGEAVRVGVCDVDLLRESEVVRVTVRVGDRVREGDTLEEGVPVSRAPTPSGAHSKTA